ncbi:MAG TPA: site-2 protease family protein [Abditibacteriaceae bacterium]|jgi:Zn-dependent protease
MNLLAPLLVLPVALLAVTLHEFAHAWMIVRLGDETPRERGRWTLDPWAHFDVAGCLVLVCAALIGAPLVTWGRPVIFDREKLREPKLDVFWVHLAGPLCNLAQAAFWLSMLWLARLALPEIDAASWQEIARLQPANEPAQIVAAVLVAGVLLNVCTAGFNLIPLPPLDGYFVLREMGPKHWGLFFARLGIGSYLLLFASLPALKYLLAPFVILARTALHFVIGLPTSNIEAF